MFVIRNAKLNDLDDIYELSQLMQFINIPNDRELLTTKIEKSLQSFNGQVPPEESVYIFVLEDLATDKVVGISLIHGLHGTKKEPHFYLKVGQEHKYSESLNTGFIHGTLKFGHTTEGYSEIGGLVLEPSYRGHPLKLGKALSFARFLFMGQNKKLFTDTIHVELMPPFDNEGKSPLWEAIGRQFLNMDYRDADILSRKNKEFILSLFPKGTIYEALLPLNARDAIGKVGEQTAPVKKMLEEIGFHYIREIDPFDGGPHYRAQLDHITVINQIKKYEVEFQPTREGENFLLVCPQKNYSFYCPLVSAKEAQKKIIVDPVYKKIINQKAGTGFKY